MKKIPNEECASICGLFCGACPAFPEECHGCFSDFVRGTCKNCSEHGFLIVLRATILSVAMSVRNFHATN